MSEHVKVERDGHILKIGIDRQKKRNAWNVEIIRAVAEAYTELSNDIELRVGVVYAEGDHFTGGLDLMDVLPTLTGGDALNLLPEGAIDPWAFMGEPCTKPVVVAVQGSAYTLAIELILAAQYSVAASDTVFAQAEVMRGIVPLGGGAHRLPRLGAKGMGWLLTGGTFSAEDALGAGLVNEVVEPGEQLDRALEVAHRIASNAPLAVQGALAITRAAERAERDAARAELATLGSLLSSEDAFEGMNAMVERREPDFKGR